MISGINFQTVQKRENRTNIGLKEYKVGNSLAAFFGENRTNIGLKDLKIVADKHSTIRENRTNIGLKVLKSVIGTSPLFRRK